jgi:iron complex outermembrane receptor protein
LTAKSLTAYGKFRSYRRNDGDYSSNVHAVEFTEEYTNPFSQEFQVGSGLGAKRFNWVAGLFYLTDNLDYRFAFNRMYLDIPNPKGSEYASIPTNVPNPNGLSSTLEMVDLTSRALFGQATLEVLPNLRATAGARYTKDTKNYSSFNDVTGIYTRKDIERDWDKTTWRAALDYQATPNNLVYGSVSTGFIAGGFAFAAPNLIYNPQLATAYEVGSKNAFGPRLQVNISGYYNQYRDLLANQFTTDPVTGAVFTYQINAGAVNSVGVEVEAQAAPTDPLRIGVTLALQNAKYGEFILGNPITPAYFPDGSLRGSNGYKVVGVTGTGSGAVMFIDLDGTQVALSPTTRLTIFASYDIKTGIGTFTPLVQSYMSSSYTSWDIKLGSDGVNVQDAYTRTDFRLIWGLPYAQWKVQAYVENIEDDAILLRGLRGGDNFIQAVYSAPRTAGVRLAYHFR